MASCERARQRTPTGSNGLLASEGLDRRARGAQHLERRTLAEPGLSGDAGPREVSRVAVK
jgi:hypothetical protein